MDLIVTDPPYGLAGDTLNKHYNRDSGMVVEGYVDVPTKEYPKFTHQWVAQAARVLRPGGSIYVVSGYTHLDYILFTLRSFGLEEVNHIIWRFSFGVWTTQKYVSSHYHILYWTKPGGKRTFNTEARYPKARTAAGNPNYRDREDVWDIPREYQTGKERYQNQLPEALVAKMIAYSSNPGDLIADFFLGNFTTAKVAMQMGRRATGFELNKRIFDKRISEVETWAATQQDFF